MSPRFKISSSVIEKLNKLDGTKASHGCLFGMVYKNSLLVVGFNLEYEREKGNLIYNNIQLNLPTDIEFCGIVNVANNLSENSIKQILQSVDVTDNPLVLTLSVDEIKSQFLIHDRLEETEYEEVTLEKLSKNFIHLRLRATLPLFCEATAKSVQEAMKSKRKKIADGQASFHFSGSDVYLLGGEAEAGVCGLDKIKINPSINDLIQSYFNQFEKIKDRNPKEFFVIPVTLKLKTSKDLISDKLIKTAVKMMSTQGNPTYCIKLPLNIDVLSMTHISTKLMPLYNVLLESVIRSLRLLEKNLLDQLVQEGIGDGAGLKLPDTFHFFPSNCGYFFSQIISRDVREESKELHRKYLHKVLDIPPTSPCFKRGNAFPFEKITANGLLINPHESLISYDPKSSVKTGIVRGYYTYHHYMQDDFDDDGWGCAYRSLQTICSWFKFQGYTDVPVPTHKQIQQCLVKIGDKPSSFIGSKQWIGSTEVSFCLQTLLNVESKIISTNSGSDLQDYASELFYHFQKYGSPIMIGGGVLAHTILGVKYCIDSGDVQYLILDPHYTGNDDISTILNKGWCGWKTNKFWNKTAYYNLCLPLTKECV